MLEQSRKAKHVRLNDACRLRLAARAEMLCYLALTGADEAEECFVADGELHWDEATKRRLSLVVLAVEWN